MRRLELYEDALPSKLEIQRELPLRRSELTPRGATGRDCALCSLSENARSPCLPAAGEPGGLLVVGEGATRADDLRGAPFVAGVGQRTRAKIAKLWQGPALYDLAIRCPSQGKPKPSVVNKCRGYLAHTVAQAEPTRVLLLGPAAALSFIGRSVSSFQTRRAYTFAQLGDRRVPVFVTFSPEMASRNRFLQRWFDEDLEWALTADEAQLWTPPLDAPVHVVETTEDAEHAAMELATEAPWLSFDVETKGRMFHDGFELISVAVVGGHSEEAWVWGQAALANPRARSLLRKLLTNARLPKVGQNVKYDVLTLLATDALHVRPVTFDTRLASKLLDPEASASLSEMAESVGMGGIKDEAKALMAVKTRAIRAALTREKKDADPPVEGKARRTTKKTPIELEDLVPAEVAAALRLGAEVEAYSYALLEPDVLHRYNARDAVATARLHKKFDAQLSTEPALTRVWDEIVLPASNAVARVEGWGVPVNRSAIVNFDRYLEAAETRARTVLDQYGAGVNWDSPMQVAALLFDKLRLRSVKQTETGKPSTDDEALKAIASKHPLPNALLEYRHVTKMRGTYAVGMLDFVTDLGRIHPNLKLDGARSGRLSCVQPNLQNIPRAKGSVEGKMARDCFVAPPGHLLLELDYSQLELRIAAMLSGDEVMLDIFASGVDYHLRTAQLIARVAWGIDAGEVTDEHRTKAKAVNFGILYGKTARALAREWGVDLSVAERVVAAVLGNFPKLRRWCDAQRAQAKRTGETWTWWDGKTARRRPLWRIGALETEHGEDNSASAARVTAENGAVNSPVQGTASDFCLRSLVACVDWIVDDGVDGVQLVLPVHDALMFQVREDRLRETASTAQALMTCWNSNGVPLTVDAKVGRSWGSMKDYDLKTLPDAQGT